MFYLFLSIDVCVNVCTYKQVFMEAKGKHHTLKLQLQAVCEMPDTGAEN